ncbi:hypothetical protein LLG96_11950 [bacterium]|nr:hypothetical protein [bacterium]
MNSIAEYIKRKINLVRRGYFHMPPESPPVNITRILQNPRNILIIPYNRMGTVLLATRVFKSFRDRYSTSRITVISNRAWSVLIQNDPTIDEVITFTDEIDNPHSKSFQLFGKQLAERKYDMAFFLSYQLDSGMAYLTRLSMADLRISFKTAEENEIQFFNVEVMPATGQRYEVDRYLEMLRTLGIGGNMRDYTMAISDNIIEKAKMRFLAGIQTDRLAGFDLTREIVGEPMTRKNAEYLINVLIHETRGIVLIFYEPSKKSVAASLKETFGKSIILIEDRPVSMIAGLLTFCSYTLTHNTDLFQLAVALKIPTICTMKKDELVQWSPGENRNLIHIERPGDGWPSSSTIAQSVKRLLKQAANDQ